MADGVNPVVDTNLGPTAPPPNPLGSAEGAVGLLGGLARMRNEQNQNILFQQQMDARHKLGEDLAVWNSQGLSPEEQIARASHQPYAPFVTPELGNFRASNLGGLQIQEIQQRMRGSGLGSLAAALNATGGDPDKFPAAFDMTTKGLDPTLVASLKPAYEAMKIFATKNLPANTPERPNARIEAFQTNLRNLGATFGLPLDKAYAATGGIAPTLTQVTGSQGQTSNVVLSGGGTGGTNASVIGTGPTLAQSEALKVQGAQAAGLAPTIHNVTDAQGRPQSVLVSGGAGGTSPTASPLLAPGGPSGAPAGTPIVGPTPTDLKRAEQRGSDMAGYQQNLDDRVKTGQQIMQTVQPAWEAMQALKKAGQSPGGLASSRMALAQIAQGFGASPETVDKISKLDDTQEISKLMVNTTMAQITQQLPASSKMAVGEFNAFMKNNPSLDTDPRAIEKIFNFWSKVHTTNLTEQTELNDFLEKGGNISRWPAEWQKIAAKQGLVNTNPTGTRDTEGAKSRPPIESFFK